MKILAHDLWNLIVSIIAGGGASFAIFNWFGQRWLEQQFQKRLEAIKHEHNKDIEHLKHQIQSLFSRVSKIHEKEFEILPKTWLLLHDAYGKAHHAIAALREYPDLDRLATQQLEKALKNCRVSDHDKSAILRLPPGERNQYYLDAMQWVELAEAEKAQVRFHNYLVRNRIFMTRDLHELFSAVDKMLHLALNDQQTGIQFGGGNSVLAAREKIESVASSADAIEKAVQRRLHYEEA